MKHEKLKIRQKSILSIKSFPSLLIFFSSLFLLMIAQYKTGFTGYVTRFVIFTQGMIHQGITLFPIINGNPYPDYPVIGTILTYLSSLLFGKISVLSIGFPYCIAAALTLVFIYKLGVIHDKKWGFYAVLFALFTWKFVDAVHFIALDIYPTLATVFCFYFVYTAKIKNNLKRLWWLPLGLIFGFFTRGPIGFVSPAAVIFIFYLIEQDWKYLIIFCLLSALLFVFCMTLLLFAAYLQGGYQFMHSVFMMEAFGRIHSKHAPRLYFYFSNGLLNYLFTVPFAIAVIIKKRKDIFKNPKSPQLKFLFYLTIWLFIILIGFTIPNTKKARYVLPIVPAISLLAAYLFVDTTKTFQTVRVILSKICFSLPIIGLISIPTALIYNHLYPANALHAYYVPAAILLLLLLLTNILFQRLLLKTYTPLSSSHSPLSSLRTRGSIFQRLLLKIHIAKFPFPSSLHLLTGILSILVINTLLFYPIMFHINLKQAALSIFLTLF